MNKKIISICCTTILTFVFSLLFTTSGFSQGVNVYELFENNSQNNIAKSTKSGKAVLKTRTSLESTYEEDFNNFYELNYKLKPTIYIEGNTIVKEPENEIPVKIKLEDVKSFSVLMSNNSIFNNVELIVINVDTPNQLMNSFDISSLSGFNNLKYVYVQCNQFNSSVNQIQKFVINAGADVTIYFMTLNPS